MKITNHINEQSLGELLTEYYSENVSQDKKTEIEELANSDSFLNEAMEGFNEFPEAINSIPDFSVKNTFFSKWKWAVSILSLVIISGFIFSYFNKNTIENNALSITEIKENTILPETEPKVLTLLMDNKVEEESIPKKIQQKVEKKRKIITTKPDEEIVIREQIELPKIKLNPVQFQAKIDYTVRKAKTKAIGYFGFLAVDYSLIYSNKIEQEQELSGTDASIANNENIKNSAFEDVVKKDTYTYKEFLKQTCFLMRERNFSLAISNLKLILKEFPRDVNAEFYLGYCHYELKNYELAIPYFDLASDNAFDFFIEDAQWFKANSLENSGKPKEAQELYNQIKQKGGYYSSKLR